MAPYLTFYPAAILVAVYGGLRAGVSATILSSLVISYFLVEPLGDVLSIYSKVDKMSMFFFMANCFVFSYICEIMLKNRSKAEFLIDDAHKTNAKLQEQTSTLEELNSTLEEEIMERVRAEERIRLQSELLDLAYDFILVRDLENRIIYWNQGAQLGYGYTSEEALGQITHNLLQTVFPIPLIAVMETLERCSRWEGELVHTCKNGQQIIVQSHHTLKRNAAGKPVAILEINHDITVQKKAEAILQDVNIRLEAKVEERTIRLQEINAALEEEIMERQAAQDELLMNRNNLAISEARYRGMFDNMPNIFIYYRVIFNEAGEVEDLEYVEVNSAFEQALNLKASEILGRGIMNVRPKIKEEEDWFEVLGKVAQTGQTEQREFYIGMHARYYRFSIYSPESGHVALIGEDVSDARKTEDALKESQEWYEAMMKKSSEGIAILDIETQHILEVNETFVRILGYASNDLIGKQLSDIGLFSIEEVRNIEFTLEECGAWSASKVQRYQRLDYSIIYAELAAVLIHHRNRKLILLSCRNVAEQQKLQAEIQHQVDVAATVQKSLLPPDYKDNKISIRSIFEPATLVSGDFYGYRWFSEGNMLHGYLIDVTGHGVASALYTSAISSLLNEIMDAQEGWTSNYLDRINRYLNQNFSDNSFAAMLAFTLDLKLKKLTCISCGINYLLAHSKTKTGLIAVPGLFLGATDVPYFETVTFPIQAGDRFYFMTDGIYDSLPEEIVENLSDFDATVESLRRIATRPDKEDDCSALCLKIRELECLPFTCEFQASDNPEEIFEQIKPIMNQFMDMDCVCRLEIVLGEAIGNASKYGQKICVTIKKVGSSLVMRVKDDGPGFAGNDKINGYRRVGLETVFQQMITCEGGRGIPIMMCWTDDMIYNAKGNEVMLIKNLD